MKIQFSHSAFFITAIVICTTIMYSQPKEYWLKTERKGIGFEYEHVTVTRIENGNLEYHIEHHIKTDVAGMNPQDIIMKSTYIVRSDLTSISFDARYQSQVTKKHIVGRCKKGIIHLTVEDDLGKISQEKIRFENGYFASVIPDVIIKKVNEKNFDFKIFNPMEMKVKNVHVEITKSDQTEVEAKVTEPMTMIFRIDRSGKVREVEYVGIGVRSYLTDSLDAQKIDYLKTDDGYTLTIKSAKVFPNVYKVENARIQMKWKDIPFEKFSFEDNRQKVVDKKISNNEYAAILEINKPDRISDDVMILQADDSFAPYLADDYFVKPSDPKIRKQLVEICGNEKKPTAMVHSILQWISTNIKADMIAETLTGPEVLEKRRGKCSEYAILFASLARAAGIPTRLVLGELYSGNQWIGHLWDEVWLDRWIAVDAASGSFVTNPSHLKFIDSPTVEGTQGVRWKLVDNLSIEILDYQEEMKNTSVDLKTGVVGHTYFNKTFSFKISSPDSTWTINPSDKGGYTVIEINPTDGNIKIALVLFAVPAGMSAKTILDGRINAISRMAKDFEKLKEDEIAIANQKIPNVVFRQSAKDQTTIVNENCLFIDGTNGYLFALIASTERFEEVRSLFLKTLESFTMIK